MTTQGKSATPSASATQSGTDPLSASKPVEAAIRQKLEAAFEPQHFEIENESYKHAVPPGSESHFKVLIVSARFEGLSRVARQRLVNETLAEELKSSVHALAQKTLTPAEWEALAQKDFVTPQCLGGSKVDSE
jgi:BolA protein